MAVGEGGQNKKLMSVLLLQFIAGLPSSLSSFGFSLCLFDTEFERFLVVLIKKYRGKYVYPIFDYKSKSYSLIF